MKTFPTPNVVYLDYEAYMRISSIEGFEFLRGRGVMPGGGICLCSNNYFESQWLRVVQAVATVQAHNAPPIPRPVVSLNLFNVTDEYTESASRCIHEWVETEGFSRRYVDCSKCHRKIEDIPMSEGGNLK